MTSRSHFPKSTAFSLQVAAVAVRGRAGRHGGRVGRRNACAGASRLAVEGAADGLDVAAGAVHEALADLPAHLHKPLPPLRARTRMENTDSWAKNPGKGKGEDYRAEPPRRQCLAGRTPAGMAAGPRASRARRPAADRGALNCPLSRRFPQMRKPSPSHCRIYTMVPRRLKKAKRPPSSRGSRFIREHTAPAGPSQESPRRTGAGQ